MGSLALLAQRSGAIPNGTGPDFLMACSGITHCIQPGLSGGIRVVLIGQVAKGGH